MHVTISKCINCFLNIYFFMLVLK